MRERRRKTENTHMVGRVEEEFEDGRVNGGHRPPPLVKRRTGGRRRPPSLITIRTGSRLLPNQDNLICKCRQIFLNIRAVHAMATPFSSFGTDCVRYS